MNKKQTLIATLAVVVVALGVVLYVVRSNPSKPPSGQTLEVGAVLPQTGPGAVLAQYIQQGLDLAVDDARKAGISVEVHVADSKNQPAVGVSAYKQLLVAEDPPVVVTALSSVTSAIAPLAEDDHTVVIGTAVGLPNVTAPSKYVFRLYPEADGLAGVIAEYAASNHQTAAVVYIDDDFGASGAAVFEQVFQQHGGTVLLKEPYRLTETDFRNQWTRIKGADPDCVWVTGYGPAYSVIVRQMRDLSVDATLFADMTLGLPVTLQNVGSAAESVVYVDGPMDPDFVRRFRAKFGEPPTSYAGYAYDIISILVQLHESGRHTPEHIREGLAALKAYPGVMGPITFQEDRDADLRFRLMQIKDGQPTPFESK
jgi:branched-chain amino acid transport system substrate-binding protein